MFSRVFLGKPLHWAVLILVAIGLQRLGEMRLHVTDFNLFVFLVIGSSAFVLALVLATTRRDEQVTRDPIPDPDQDKP